MTSDNHSHLELLADLDSLLVELRALASAAERNGPAPGASALLKRLLDRAQSLRLRFEAPLVVATLGGTGTGKSSLVNALVGPRSRRPAASAPPRASLC